MDATLEVLTEDGGRRRNRKWPDAVKVRIMVAIKPVDFRNGHDGLAALVQNKLRKEPFTGTVFIFRARRADRLKLLYWDGTGLVFAIGLERMATRWLTL